jgi:hypothetical protein
MTTIGIQSISFTFQRLSGLMPCSVRPAAGSWQAAMPEQDVRYPLSLSCGDYGRSSCLVGIEKTFDCLQKINALPAPESENKNPPDVSTRRVRVFPVPQNSPVAMTHFVAD